ncbi:MAG: TM1266 family iron-only hydrogenase system putative regulator [candidate division WOR-3 bacterium]|nr:TM1266 family iron-only hydrogenase system putative regulator [candidate division WOR-3 bacterium]
METRLGIVGIIIQDRSGSAKIVNRILGDFGDIIKGRMGLPSVKENICAIALVVEGTGDRIGAMTGRIGQIDGVRVSTTFMKDK